MRYKKINFFSILIIFVLLIIFSHKRNFKKQTLRINIDFKNEIGNFLDSLMVNKLLIQRNDTAFFIKEDMLDLKVVEDLLISNPMIANADIFRTPQGILNVRLEERKPIIRIIHNNEEFYVDDFGFKVPLSKKYSARVPIFYGQADNILNDLVNLIQLIKLDSFAKAEIIDLKYLNKNYVLGLRSFPFKVIWGKNSKNKEKIKKLKFLYSYLDNKESKKLKEVNLIFNKQIVLNYEQNGK